jgi:hypothetical protein
MRNCPLFFQPAWEYLLFDNRMNQARTRLVSRFVSGVPEQIEFENTERSNKFVPIVTPIRRDYGRNIRLQTRV